ncbi:MAG: hypothetical protein K2M95_07405 [Clostridiales bacterium]|nr:hypothetical protein [Clostridiales bacterium]
MGVDFAANASSKAIKEDISLSAAPDDTGSSVTYTTAINSSNQYVYTFNYNGTYAENKKDQSTSVTNGWRHQGNNVGMDGSIQTITLNPGKYLLELWGAQGGQGMHNISVGGKGGYVKGYYTITGSSPVTLYVAVGGKGSDNYINNASTGSAAERNLAFVSGDWKNLAKGGGWNGGGGIIATDSAGGGGATHIALSTWGDGQLKNYITYSGMTKTEDLYQPATITANHSGDVLMVAGGGGGGGWGDHPFVAGYTGAGGGTTGGEGAYHALSNGWGSGTVCHGLGGTQTAGGGHKYTNASGAAAHGHRHNWGASPSNGFFGQGGVGVGCDHAGGGGGGGWYGGGGADVFGGGGGSSYTKAGVITDVSHTQGNREGHGMARITDLTTAPSQSSIPTITLTRHATTTVAVASGTGTTLLGTDPNSLPLSVHTAAIYQVNGLADTTTQETLRARTWAATEKADATLNAWLSYSFSADNKTITLQATRYWTGTKPFYVRIKNSHGVPSWFKFYAKVEGGELKKDKTLPSSMLDDFKFGKSTTQVPTERRKKRETSPLRFASVEVTETRRQLIQYPIDYPHPSVIPRETVDSIKCVRTHHLCHPERSRGI